MKRFFIVLACLSLISVTACKKDRQCKCTVTTTSPNGNVNTDLDQNTTYVDIRKSDAKTRCQNYTTTYVSQSGGTTVRKGECKLSD